MNLPSSYRDLELPASLLPPPKRWDYRHVPYHACLQPVLNSYPLALDSSVSGMDHGPLPSDLAGIYVFNFDRSQQFWVSLRFCFTVKDDLELPIVLNPPTFLALRVQECISRRFMWLWRSSSELHVDSGSPSPRPGKSLFLIFSCPQN